MARKPEVARIVDALVGRWQGRGKGGYPTIDAFTYREELQIAERPDHPALHYEQRTWRDAPDGQVVSHWETGLVRVSSDGSVRLHNAQGGRAESMSGSWEETETGWTIQLEGIGYTGDTRVIASTREIRLEDSSLSYRMSMETASTNRMHLHLEATLDRIVRS